MCGVVEKQRVRLRALIARVRDWSMMKAGVHAGDEICSSDTRTKKKKESKQGKGARRRERRGNNKQKRI